MTTNAMSGHGTLLQRAPAATPGVFTTIGELGDITPPALTRNEFDATTQQEDIDSYVLGVLRRGAFSVSVNFIPTNATHDHLTGLQQALIDNEMCGWKFIFPDVSNTTWVASGQVQQFVPHAPVDGKLSADVTIRFSGQMWIGATLVG